MKTHWKKLQNPDYLGAWDFQPNEIKLLTIKEVKKVDVYDPQTRKKEPCSACFWIEDTKPMILNTTNAKTISAIMKSNFIEDWIGGKIGIRLENVKAFGDYVDAVRVFDLPELTPNHPKWNGAAKSIKSGQVTIDQVKKRFIISPENETLLCKK